MSRLQEIHKLLEEGKTLLLSAKITAYSSKQTVEDSVSITAIYNKRITNSTRTISLPMGISFSPKRFLKELSRLEKEGKLKVRKAGKIYLLDGEEGRVYATIGVDDDE